jgi:alkanesulfonate monooxygenase SsuD/methylene tetrahydromethanopterin reductase-like flavin-dependent oxidoreductase (luciferase family)
MLGEAIDVLRLLWRGGYRTHRGKHDTGGRSSNHVFSEPFGFR